MKTEYKVYADGNAWCAVNDQFVNLQESISGWGPDPASALKDLIEIEDRIGYDRK